MAIEKYAQEQRLKLIMYVEKIFTRKTERIELQHALKEICSHVTQKIFTNPQMK